MPTRLSTIKFSLVVALLLTVFSSTSFAVAQPNAQINYQGKLTDASGVAVADGTYNMRFWLLQSTSQATTSAVWTESLTGINQVQITNGLFSVMLGSTSALTSVDFSQSLYLGVEIGGTGGTPTWDGEMSPRKPLGTVPAAFESFKLGGVASSSFLRSDEADTASGLLTFTGGLISTASSTIAELSFDTATGTRLVLNSDSLTDLTGAGLINTSGVLSVSSSSLNLDIEGLTDVTAMTETLGDLLYWNGTAWADLATSSLKVALDDTTGTLGVSQGGTGGTSFTAGQLLFGDGTNPLGTSASLFWDTSTGRLGVGSTTPAATLSVTGNAWFDSNVISFASSSASTLVLRYFTEATSTIKDNSAFAFTIATSTSDSPIFRIDTSGAYANTLVAGSFTVNNGAIAYDAATDQTTIQNLALGTMTFGDDTGAVTWTDMGITGAAATGTAMSYTAQLDGNPLLIVYGEADGQGGLENSGLGIGTSTPWARLAVMGDVTDATKPLFTVASSTGSSLFHITHDGKVGVGTTSPSATLSVTGDTYIGGAFTNTGTVTFTGLTGGLLTTNSAGLLATTTVASSSLAVGNWSNGYILQASTTATGGFDWVATSSLGITAGGSSNWTDAGAYLTTLTGGDGIIIAGSSTIGDGTATGGLTITGGATSTLSFTSLEQIYADNFIATNGSATSTLAGNLSIGNHCVVGNTRLRRRRRKADGTEEDEDIDVKDIEEGDLVASLDTKTGAIVYRTVRGLYRLGEKDIYVLTTTSGKFIRTTNEHPYLVRHTTSDEFADGAWLKVAQMHTGMLIAVTDEQNENALWEAVTSITIESPEMVYDIEIDDTHNFVAGGIIAHNTLISGGLGVGAYNGTAGSISATEHVNIGAAKEYRIGNTGVLTLAANGALIAGDLTGDARGAGALDIQSARWLTTQVASAASSTAVGIGNTITNSGYYGPDTLWGNTVVGYGNTASGYYQGFATAVGFSNIASDDYASAFGYQNTVSGKYSSAFGYLNTASGDGASAFGNYNIALGDTSSASGYFNITSGYHSSAFGSVNNASGTKASAFGYSNIASSTYSSAFGYLNTASGDYSSAFGNHNTATGDYSTASGYVNVASGFNSSAFGYLNTASGDYSAIFGHAITNNIDGSTMIGPSDSAKLTILSSGNLGVGTTTPTAKLSVVQSAASDILNLFDGATEVFTVLDGGNVGIGSSTPYAKLSVTGDLALTGGLYDNTATRGTAGQILQTTGTGVTWIATTSLGIVTTADDLTDNSIEDLSDVAAMTENYGDLLYWNGSAWADVATSSLGLGNGTFLGLSDTPSSYTTAAIPFVSGSALAFDSEFVYDGTNLGLGTASPGAMLDIFGTSNGLRLSYDGSNYSELSVNSSGDLTISSSGGTGSVVTLGSGLAEDLAFLLDGSGADWYAGLDDTDDLFKIGTGSEVGTSTLLQISAATTTFNTALYASTTSASPALTVIQSGTGDLLNLFDGSTEVFSVLDGGWVGIGTTTPNAKLSIQTTGFSGDGIMGIDQYLQTTNSVDAAVQYGNRFFIDATSTATTTLVGSMFRIDDDTTFGNTVRGLEVQANRGGNTQGENTALSGFARTFGVRGYTSGDAGAVYEPAGGFFETGGTTQGNALRGYSSSITTASLLSLFQDGSDFDGTGLEMNFGNTTGSFSSSTSKFLDFQNAGTSVFTVTAFGTTTIGDGTTSHMASLQVGYGGICVDNDGTCTATSTGWVVADGFATGNSDLAEMYFSDTELKTGEIVVMTGDLSVERATTDSELPILGVVSTNPGLTIGSDDTPLQEGEVAYPIALAGRVPVQLSNENGAIKRGDALMLSSVPGVAMKATGVGTTVGIALEDFDETRLYSDTYLNQFGDSMVEPSYEPIFTNYDMRIHDGCYYGGGSMVGETPCVPLIATTSEGQITEANALAEQESIAEQLEALRDTTSQTKTLEDGREVQVGQIVMFVDKSYRWLDATQAASLGVLTSTSSVQVVGANAAETLFDRLVALANRFVDGVLSVLTLKADRVETSELCVDGVCVDAATLQQLLDNTAGLAAPTPGSDGGETPPGTEPVPLPSGDGEVDTNDPLPPPSTEPEPISDPEVGSTEEVIPEPVPEEIVVDVPPAVEPEPIPEAPVESEIIVNPTE
jgi:hypothetical protein